MTEGLFVLTTLFVAYVIYVIVNEKKTSGDKTTKPVAAAKQEAQQATVFEKPKAAASKPKAEPAAAKPKPAAAAKKAPAAPTAIKSAEAKPVAAKKAPSAAKPAAPKPAAVQKIVESPVAESTTIKGTGLKDPTTGEVATTYSNYRFTKRWIKEALVSEKLVEKVYKNDELNASVEARIKAGIIKLEGMKKYKP